MDISHIILVIADLVHVNTRWVVSVNLSKDAFYFNYSDNKKRVGIDFTASPLFGFSIVVIFLTSLGIPSNL